MKKREDKRKTVSNFMTELVKGKYLSCYNWELDLNLSRKYEFPCNQWIDLLRWKKIYWIMLDF